MSVIDSKIVYETQNVWLQHSWNWQMLTCWNDFIWEQIWFLNFQVRYFKIVFTFQKLKHDILRFEYSHAMNVSGWSQDFNRIVRMFDCNAVDIDKY